ncbi:hypothetical protein C7S16_7259 [Burkholderia thailandensis]|uniref:Uncharacterized protein n=1 Tax=Burkholderia thailandensis TaxID=57975 RepID=A0AAW9CM85_BURTH|nr:hypothetical protein [Burkholderia thailandensis]
MNILLVRFGEKLTQLATMPCIFCERRRVIAASPRAFEPAVAMRTTRLTE